MDWLVDRHVRMLIILGTFGQICQAQAIQIAWYIFPAKISLCLIMTVEIETTAQA